jgi:hypothetical protein
MLLLNPMLATPELRRPAGFLQPGNDFPLHWKVFVSLLSEGFGGYAVGSRAATLVESAAPV